VGGTVADEGPALILPIDHPNANTFAAADVKDRTMGGRLPEVFDQRGNELTTTHVIRRSA